MVNIMLKVGGKWIHFIIASIVTFMCILTLVIVAINNQVTGLTNIEQFQVRGRPYKIEYIGGQRVLSVEEKSWKVISAKTIE